METGFARLRPPPPSLRKPRVSGTTSNRAFLRAFLATQFPDSGLCGRSRILVAAFGALSLHPEIPFPAAVVEREVRMAATRCCCRESDGTIVMLSILFAIADGFCCGLSGIEAEDCSLASLKPIFLTLPAAGAQRSVLGGKIADTRRPGPPPVGGGPRLCTRAMVFS